MQDSTLQLSVAEFPPFSFQEEEKDFNVWADKIIESSTSFPAKTETFSGTTTREGSPSWIILILLVGFSCIAISRSVYRKRFLMLQETLSNWKLSRQIIRYEKVYTHPVNILMTFNFIILLPLFFSIVYTKLYAPSLVILEVYLIFIPPLVAYLILKLLSYKFSGWLWGEKTVIEEYLFQSNLLNKYLGVAFLILTSLVVYSKIEIQILAITGLGILSLFSAFQLLRGIMIGLENGKHLFFIIAYLCTLEILPWLVIIKLINSGL